MTEPPEPDGVHRIGITKGIPVPPEGGRAGLHPKQVEFEARRVDKRTGRTRLVATWRGTCTCGWRGVDHRSPEQAQSDALSHQAGYPVERTRLVRLPKVRKGEWAGLAGWRLER